MPDKKAFLPAALFSCLICAFYAIATAAPGVDLVGQVEKIQKKYRDFTSLSLDFKQLTRSGGRLREGAGNAVFFRPVVGPGVMRWNYTEPDTQIILNDGSHLSIYTQKDNQVLVTSAEALQSDITYAFFAGTRNVLDDFTPKPASERFIFNNGDTTLQALQLVPKKPQTQIKALHIWYDSTFLIKKLIMEDYFDSLTELSFSNIKPDTLQADSQAALKEITRLDLPPGTEVIRQ